MSYLIYKHTVPNGKVYIGLTARTARERWKNGNGYKHNPHFTSAIEKYGWENIKHEILFENLSKEEACQKEIELIKIYNATNREFGYNQSTGGEYASGHHTVSKKMLEANRRIGLQRRGAKLPEEYRIHISDSKKEEKNPMYGRRFSEEHKRKISEANKGKTKGRFVGGKSVRAKRVSMYSLNGEYIKTFGSTTEAGREIKKHYSNIVKCCTGQQKTVGGYRWIYADDI